MNINWYPCKKNGGKKTGREGTVVEKTQREKNVGKKTCGDITGQQNDI